MEQANEDLPPSGNNKQLLLIGGGIALLLVLLALIISIVMVFVLRSDVADLETQVRKSAKATKAMQEEIANLKEHAAKLAEERRAPAPPPTPQPQAVDAVDTAHDCVIRPGAKNAFADCKQFGSK